MEPYTRAQVRYLPPDEEDSSQHINCDWLPQTAEKTTRPPRRRKRLPASRQLQACIVHRMRELQRVPLAQRIVATGGEVSAAVPRVAPSATPEV